MTLRVPCVALALITVSCSTDIDPVGTYETTPASMVRAIEATLPSKESAVGKMMRQRLESMKEGAPNWKVALDLAADHRFTLSMVLPLVPGTTRMTGNWQQTGTTLDLEVTHLNGEALSEPKPIPPGTIEADAITLQPEPSAPRFVLEKLPS